MGFGMIFVIAVLIWSWYHMLNELGEIFRFPAIIFNLAFIGISMVIIATMFGILYSIN